MSDFTGRGGLGIDQLLQMGIDTAKSGNNEGAKVILKQVIQKDKRNDRAWTWLAFIEPDPVQKRRYLQNAVRINPGNRPAQEALSKMVAKEQKGTDKTMFYGSIAIGIMVLLSVMACMLVLLT
jgi:hypothetical protein